MKHLTKTEQETISLAKKFVGTLKSGGVFGLIGDLGAGKTAFVKGVAQALGIKSRISSPTFVLMRVFKTKHKAIERLVHVDAYRLKKAVSLTAIGLEDFMKDSKTLVMIEWADKFISLLPNKKNSLRFKHVPLGRIISLPAFLKIPSKSTTPRQRQSTNRRD